MSCSYQIRPGQVEDDVGPARENAGEGAGQEPQVRLVVGVGRQMDVERALGFELGVVVFLVDREGERRPVVREDESGPVAVVHVAVHDGRPRDCPLALEHPDRNRDVVEEAEALAVVLAGVMKAATEVDAQSARPRREVGRPVGPRWD